MDEVCYSISIKRNTSRSISHEALEELRIRAVERVLAGESASSVISATGFARPVIYKWMQMYRDGGLDALRSTKAPGALPKLTGSQLRWLVKTISTKTPLQLKFEFALWTREIVAETIWRKFKVSMSVSAVGRLLKRLGFTPQRPMARAIEQNPEYVQTWLVEEYPRLRRAAKKAGAAIFFGDEASIRSDYHKGTTWAPIGETPVVRATGSRVSCNMISAVSAKGEMRFMIAPQRVTASVFVEFLKRMMQGATTPIYLIVDGHPTHRAKVTSKFVASTKGKLKLVFLPPYSPELNPDEQVWNHVKNHRIGRKAILNRDQLVETARAALRSIQKTRGLVSSFFALKDTAYAA